MFTDGTGTDYGFEIHVTASSATNPGAVELTSLSTLGNPLGLTRDLGFRHNAGTPFFVSGSSIDNFGSVFLALQLDADALELIGMPEAQTPLLPRFTRRGDVAIQQSHRPTNRYRHGDPDFRHQRSIDGW